jgi:hypothetical protein
MSRQEDFIQAGIDYRMEHGKPMAIGGDIFADVANEMNRCKSYEAGAEHGYQYAIQKVVNDENKAFTNGWDAAIEETIEFFDSISCCEWVEDIEVKELVKKYKKFMNE